MTTKEFAEIMTKLSLFYDNFSMNEEKMKLWFPFFKNENVNKIRTAIGEHIKNEQYTPTIASINKYLKDDNVNLPSEEALYFVKTLNLDYNKSTSAKNKMIEKSQVIWEAFKGVIGRGELSWREYRLNGHFNFDKAFKDMYETLCKKDSVVMRQIASEDKHNQTLALENNRVLQLGERTMNLTLYNSKTGDIIQKNGLTQTQADELVKKYSDYEIHAKKWNL